MNLESLKAKTVTSTSGCWLWKRATTYNGYGMVNVQNRYRRVHRVAWELARGSIPERMEVCHSCDVRNCINPDHLFLGTHRENMDDAKKKGRLSQKRDICARGHSMSGDNVVVRSDGTRRCRICRNSRHKSQPPQAAKP